MPPASRRAITHSAVIVVEGLVDRAWLHTEAKEIYHLHLRYK